MARPSKRTAELEGLDGVDRLLQLAGDRALSIAASALYVAAGDLADQVSANIAALPTEEYKYPSNSKPRKLSPMEKQILQKAVPGISRFNKSGGVVETSISLGKDAGYALATKKGKGTAIAVIARSIESGTSFRVKQPYFRPAVNKARAKMEADMLRVVNDKVTQLLNNYNDKK